MNNNFCDSVITIPQTLGTCWFNSLLMMIFYSQNSRKLLLHYNNFNDKNDELNLIFKSLLYKSYIKNPEIFNYLLLKSPQYILSLLNFTKITEDGKILQNDYGYNINFYIHTFLDRLNLEYLTLDCFDLKSNIFYTSISEMIKFRIVQEKNSYLKYYNYENFRNEILRNQFLNKFNDKIKNEIPKYLIINLHPTSKSGIKLFISNNPTLSNPFIFQNNIKNLNKLPDEINYKGYTYILDSVSLENYNSHQVPMNHAICGITCKNKKYVYNGWMKITNDTAMDKLKLNNQYPCELMPFDWNINKSNNFCLNVNLCKLDKVQYNKKPVLCFSFNKDNRTIIYVLKNKDFKSLDHNINSKSSSINSKKEIKEKIKEIKKEIKEIKDDKDYKDKCPENKIYNPKTKKCVLKTGKIGKLLLNKNSNTNTIKEEKQKDKCPEDKIYNPETKRCVLKSGKIGKLLVLLSNKK